MIKRKVTKILVPINGTENSKHGLEMAISIARQYGATITGVYVINTVSHSEFVGTGSLGKSANDEIKKVLDDAKVLAAQNGIVFNGKTLHGDVGFSIINMAHNNKHKFNLIVIGSRNRGAIKKMFLGSVSNYVVQASKIPVVVVK